MTRKHIVSCVMAAAMIASGSLILLGGGCGDSSSGTCPGTQPTKCGVSCVDTRTDAANCGGCGNVCPTGTQCRNSVCATQCAVPQQEACDGIDNNCDGQVDENLTRDCSNPCGRGDETCQNGGWRNCTAPVAVVETCNNKDDDCDGQVDEDVKTKYYRDNDNDMYGSASEFVEACTQPSGYATNNTDCNDNDATINPGRTEICNDKDDDCDGTKDEGCTCTPSDTRNCGEGGDTGECEYGTQTCITGGTWGPCTGGVRPSAESCDAKDNNCDGQTDNGMAEDTYEANDDCAAVRELPRANEGSARVTVSNATLYSTDGGDDVDWYKIQAAEATHLDCILKPGQKQCYFYFDFEFAPPAGADRTKYTACVYASGTCGDFDFEYCTDSSDWVAASSAYKVALLWEGICGLNDDFTFFVKISAEAGTKSCRPYTLKYQMIFEGGIGGDFCTG